MNKPVFAILISGKYTVDVDGERIEANRCAIVGLFDSQAEAQAAFIANPNPGPNWGACEMWIDSATIGAPLLAD